MTLPIRTRVAMIMMMMMMMVVMMMMMTMMTLLYQSVVLGKIDDDLHQVRPHLRKRQQLFGILVLGVL